jgi:DNA polymerase III subunit gamma/tau
VGQEHVRTTLGNAIGQGRIAHGYIFSGQRGTGKTTVARIMARCLNCEKGPTIEPCLTCSACKEIAAGNCIDVIEIDAASNRGINEMRELSENVRFRPARDRFKVFIVDEAHQITSEAFNALLKTLEEPPEWVAFILCTTESHKIPTTIASRCQQFSFRSVDFKEIVSRMQWICGEEKIEADDDALAVIAQVGEGSVRDSLSALDQAIACCGTRLTEPEVRELLGVFSLDALGEVTRALASANHSGYCRSCRSSKATAGIFQHFCRELARYSATCLSRRWWDRPAVLSRLRMRTRGKCRRYRAALREDLTRYLHITLELYQGVAGLAATAPAPRTRLAAFGPCRAIDQPGRSVAGMAAKPMTAVRLLHRGERALPRTGATAPPVVERRCALACSLPARAEQYDGGGRRRRINSASPSEWQFTAPRGIRACLQGPLAQGGGESSWPPLRISYVPNETAAAPKAAAAASGNDDEVTQRALDNPEVKASRNNSPAAKFAQLHQSEGITAMKFPGNMGNMQGMMKQAQEMQKRMGEEIARSAWKHRPAAAWLR